jgi:hypothetical protein
MPRYQFQAQSDASYSFEDFLRDAERTGISDPGDAMMTVLRRTRVPGLNPEQIQRSSTLDPCGRPANLLAFLRHICSEGQWGVNLEIRID